MGKSVRRRMRKRRGVCRETALRQFTEKAWAPQGGGWPKFGRRKGNAIAAFALEVYEKGWRYWPKGTVLSEVELLHLVDTGVVGAWVEEKHKVTVVKREIGVWDEEGNRVYIDPPKVEETQAEKDKRIGDKFRADMAAIRDSFAEQREEIARESDLNALVAEMVASGNILTTEQIQAELDRRAGERKPQADPLAKLKAHHARMDKQRRHSR